MASNPQITRVITEEIGELFSRIDEKLVRTGHALPSEVERTMEEQSGLGADWREWWEESGDLYV